MQALDLLQQNSFRPQVIDGIIVQNDPVNGVDPEGLQAVPVPNPLFPPVPWSPSPRQLTPGQWEQMKDDLWFFNPWPLYDWMTDQVGNACEFAKSKKDRNWKAPGMPGWQNPGEPPNIGDPNWYKPPDDYDKWPWWRKFLWRLGRAAAGGG